MIDGAILTGDELKSDVVVDCDVCVIGSGSGGAWLAHELVKQGKRVVMLEEGGHHTRREFDMTEARAFSTLYQELGNRATDDLAITILQGRSVGGGTTVNWTTSFRTPDRILNHWRDVHGIDTLSPEILAPHFEAIEKRLHIAAWPEAMMNANNRVLWDGCGALGYERQMLRRNVNACLNLGTCGMGCPVDAKQSMLVTMIPDAVEAGLQVYANTSARSLRWTGRRVEAVVAEVLNPVTNRPTGVAVTVKPKLVCVSGGAINSPALLLRSGLEAQGRVGERTWVHPALISLGRFERQIKAYEGAPQSVSSHHFFDRGPGKMGFFIEVPPIHPMLTAVVLPTNGPDTQEQFRHYLNLNATLALMVDGLLPEEQGATVRLRSNGYSRFSINYHFSEALWEACKTAQRELARIQFAAGAIEVQTFHQRPVVMKSVDELYRIDDAMWEPTRVKLTTAHQLGGCSMGRDAATSVVDPTLRFHTMDNLFVVDGSVLPTSLGVNPQETIFAIARWAAKHIGQAVS